MAQGANKPGSQNRDPYYEDEPDWMEYMERSRAKALNREGGVFEVKDRLSLNTAPSVFERGTVFSTGDSGNGKV